MEKRRRDGDIAVCSMQEDEEGLCAALCCDMRYASNTSHLPFPSLSLSPLLLSLSPLPVPLLFPSLLPLLFSVEDL